MMRAMMRVFRTLHRVPRFIGHQNGWFHVPMLREISARFQIIPSGCDFSLREGLRHARYPRLPLELASHPLVAAAWHGLDATKVWDAHCHLFGNGDSGSGLWFNPAMAKLRNPTLFAQRLFYLNGGCVDDTPIGSSTSRSTPCHR